jgi:hypothetical protein
MNLSELITQLPPIEELRLLWLVFDSDINTAINNIQSTYFSNSQHKISTILLIDGNYTMCADILTETTNGIYSEGFKLIPVEFYNDVIVLSFDSIILLIPISNEQS